MSLVQLFAKPPVSGKVKTRLIPDIGAEKATEVFRHCLSSTIELATNAPFDYEIWLGEASDDAIFDRQRCRLQQGKDLGSRMLYALNQGLSNSPDNSVMLIGSDCLDLTQQHLDQTDKLLQSHDLVLLPCFDGGFALIGCRRIDSNLFDSVVWSSENVLAQTLKNAETLEYKVHLLETVRDIDTLADLNHYPALCALIHDD